MARLLLLNSAWLARYCYLVTCFFSTLALILGNLGESWEIFEDHAWWTTCMVDHMYGVDHWWSARPVFKENAHFGPPYIKILPELWVFRPAAHVTAMYVGVNGSTVNVKGLVFVFCLGGSAPPDRQAGAH